MRFAKARGLFPVSFLTVAVFVGSAGALELGDLVDPGVKVATVADGCKFTEGPAWSPQGTVYFSDIPNSRIVQILADGTTKDFLNPSNKSNGLMFDSSGRLYVCEGGAGRIVRRSLKTDEVTILADKYDDKRFNGPNDLALDSYGGVYFSDPNYGGAPAEQSVEGVYYIDSAKKVSRVVADLARPNGVLVSPNGLYLYVADWDKAKIHRYGILAPGKLSKGKVIFSGDSELDGEKGPDGMAHDVHGNVYAAYKGITVLDPDGTLIGRMPVPTGPSNCAFGGKDRKTLFVTAGQFVYSIPTKTTGVGFAPAVDAKTRDEQVGKIMLKVPASWDRQRPRSRFRLAQFGVPASGADKEAAELVAFSFPGGGGGVEANIQRWVGQFAPKGRVVTQYQGTSPQGEYVVVDLLGTYNKSVGPPIQRRSKAVPGSRVVNVYLKAKAGNYFLKFAGLESTVSANVEYLRRAFGANATSEKALGGNERRKK